MDDTTTRRPEFEPGGEQGADPRSAGQEGRSPQGAKSVGAALRVLRYALSRTLVLSIMVAIGVFLAIVVLNYGGYIDKIFQAQIGESLNSISLSNPGMSQEELLKLTEQARWGMEEAYGLHQPFLLRCVRWFYKAITFDWGEAHMSLIMRGLEARSPDVRTVILVRLPRTLMLAGTANLLLFFAGVLTALRLSQRHGGLLDKLMVGLSPISTIPNWAYGILLIVVFAGALRLLPFGGMYDDFPPATQLGYVPIVLKHMILPVAAIFLSLYFQSVYAWRAFFLVHAGEDYVEMAKAQGLPTRTIERRYLLRPILPYIITSFAIMLITFWQGILVLEVLFDWPGIGQLFVTALRQNERGVSTAVIVVFALLLALTVLLLDIIYALVDPRVKVAGNGQAVRSPVRRRCNPLGWLSRAGRKPISAPAGGWQPEPPAAAAEPEEPGHVDAGGLSGRLNALLRSARSVGSSLHELLRYPSAVVGLLIIVALLGVSIYTLITIPYKEAIRRWMPETPERYLIPENAQPAWVNLFRRDPLPPTVSLSSLAGTARKDVARSADGTSQITLTYTIDWPYGGLPQEAAVYFTAAHKARKPFVTMTWFTPDGRQFDLGHFGVVNRQAWYASTQIPAAYVGRGTMKVGWLQGTGGAPPAQVLFQDPSTEVPTPISGTYQLLVTGFTFESDSDVDAELVLLGQVYGWAGTDSERRDLSVALLWGTPVALVFGLFGAVATSLLSMFFAAAGAWLGGWVDGLVQRLTEINMILPALPIAIMIYWLYEGSIWVILGVIVLLNIFGSSVKSYRAAFLQVKEAPYVEAARAYGAGSWRIIRHYLFPRIFPILIPQLVVLVPTYVFFEATLAFLGVSDPNLPTWGKVIYDAFTRGAWAGYTYWVMEPTVLIILTGLSFAMVGFALDRILNPRLRTV
jgi:peptide/nickel transport system permease protein